MSFSAFVPPKDPLVTLEEKLQLVRDRVRGVCSGFESGFYLHGEGGISKSYTVLQTLEQAGRAHKVTNTRLTSKGLFNLLKTYPDHIHLIEDCESMFRDRTMAGILRSALWAQADEHGNRDRLITWDVAPAREEFFFTGGLILTANAPLENAPEMRAIKQRIQSYHFCPTNAEIAALMRLMAKKGHRHGEYQLSPEAALEVAEVVIERTNRVGRNLDLRLFVNGCQDRLMYENGIVVLHWHVLLESRMKERAITATVGVRAAKKAHDEEVVKEIVHLPPKDRLEAWKRLTGKSTASLYRRLEDKGFSADTPA